MKLLVPFDFTSVANTALSQANFLSESLSANIELLHIVSKESQIAEAEEKFEQVVKDLDADLKKKVSTTVRVGDIFTDISKEAEEQGAGMIVMGTHGAKGLQKVLGSYAIKVVTSSKTPFIITQERKPESPIHKIVLPVSLSKESMQIVKYATYLAKEYKAEIHVICENETDEFLVNKLNNNIKIIRKHLSENDVKFEIVKLEGKDSFQAQAIDYGAKNRADLFAIAYFTESILPQFDRFAQDMITNKFEIPVLIVSTHQVSTVTSNYSFIGI